MTTELDMDDVAVQLVYLVEGIEDRFKLQRVTDRLTGIASGHPLTDGGGHIGMVLDLIPKATAVSAHFAEQAEIHAQDFPGVIEYEVTTFLGAWYADNPAATDAEFAAKLAEKTAEFFSQ